MRLPERFLSVFCALACLAFQGPMAHAQTIEDYEEQARLLPFMRASDAMQDGREDGLTTVPQRLVGSMLFASSVDEPGFVLDRTQTRTLFRRADDFEVISLRMRTGARGDVFLRDDTGRLMFRLNDLGGMTYYSARAGTGSPVMAIDKAYPISPPERPEDLNGALGALVADHAEQTGQSLTMEIDASLLAEPEWVMDAARLALRALGAEPALKGRAGQIEVVVFIPAARTRLAVDANRLIVPVSPALGYDGRPSSRAITRILAQPAR